MLLACDVGGTKTLMGLFERGTRRPVQHATHSYATTSFSTFGEILDAFWRDVPRPSTIDAAAIGVAGPVMHDRARLTNAHESLALPIRTITTEEGRPDWRPSVPTASLHLS